MLLALFTINTFKLPPLSPHTHRHNALFNSLAENVLNRMCAHTDESRERGKPIFDSHDSQNKRFSTRVACIVHHKHIRAPPPLPTHTETTPYLFTNGKGVQKAVCS